MSKVLDVKRQYKVSGLLLSYIFDLVKLCSPADQKNIMLHNGKRYFTVKGDLIKEKDKENEIIIEEVNSLKDITIGKLIAEFDRLDWEEV